MKRKAISLFLVLALVVGICPAAFAVGAPQDNATEIQPREILTLSKSQFVTVGADKEYVALVTVEYTVRPESSNSSGHYITGILGASIRNVKGWTAVGGATVKQSGVTYTKNHQVASVPITYEASIGVGYSTYSDTVVITL